MSIAVKRNSRFHLRIDLSWFKNGGKPNRGFGFIRVSGTQEDIFVHVSEIERSLNRPFLSIGEQVKFNIIDTYKGQQAKDLEIL